MTRNSEKLAILLIDKHIFLFCTIVENVSKTRGPVLTAAVLAQSVERLTAGREVAGSIPGAGPLLRVLK